MPDWYGNNGRSIIQPLFDGRTYGQNSTNYGGYNNPEVNALIDAALTAPDAEHAAYYWQQADQKIMEDAAIVPLLDRAQTLFHSSRVHGARYLPTTAYYDYTVFICGELLLRAPEGPPSSSTACDRCIAPTRLAAHCAIRFLLRSNLPSDAIATVQVLAWSGRGWGRCSSGWRTAGGAASHGAVATPQALARSQRRLRRMQ